jgi:hypothetical protein
VDMDTPLERDSDYLDDVPEDVRVAKALEIDRIDDELAERYDQPAPATPAEQPQAGDAVHLDGTWTWGGLDLGAIGVIEGVIGQRRPELEITFNASTFRDDHIVSCSGGPGSIATPASELHPTGETVELRVWRFKDGHREAHNDEHYTVTVPLWSWRPVRDGAS